MLTGESEETLPEGKIVQATVRRVLDQQVFCNLESGITRRIVKDDLSDGTCIDHVEQITEGSILTCRVKSVQKERYSVDLSCKLSELSDQFRSRQERDRYYANDEFILRSEQEKVQKEKEHPKKSFKPRMIEHPQFQNISESDAIKVLPLYEEIILFKKVSLSNNIKLSIYPLNTEFGWSMELSKSCSAYIVFCMLFLFS